MLANYPNGQAHEPVIDVATGMIMSGRVFQCNPNLTDYAKIMVFEFHPIILRHNLDFSTKDGTYLGDTKDNFVL